MDFESKIFFWRKLLTMIASLKKDPCELRASSASPFLAVEPPKNQFFAFFSRLTHLGEKCHPTKDVLHTISYKKALYQFSRRAHYE